MVRFLLTGLLPTMVFGSEPRMDLYKQIKKETGVSLREAYHAVEKGNRGAATDLQIYARRVGAEPIEKALEEEISSRMQVCTQQKSMACEESVSDLTGQLEHVKSMQLDYKKLAAYERMYFNLLIYGFNIKTKVLKASLEEWNSKCFSQEKINTRTCQDKLYETHTLADIANDLALLALAKSQGAKTTADQRKSILDRISRYENK